MRKAMTGVLLVVAGCGGSGGGMTTSSMVASEPAPAMLQKATTPSLALLDGSPFQSAESYFEQVTFDGSAIAGILLLSNQGPPVGTAGPVLVTATLTSANGLPPTLAPTNGEQGTVFTGTWQQDVGGTPCTATIEEQYHVTTYSATALELTLTDTITEACGIDFGSMARDYEIAADGTVIAQLD